MTNAHCESRQHHDSVATSPRGEHGNESHTLQSVDSSPNVAALLLTNVAAIASNELNHSVLVKPMLFDPTQMTLPSKTGIVPGTMTCACTHYDYGRHPAATLVSSDDENHLPHDLSWDVATSGSGGSPLHRPIMPTSSPVASGVFRPNKSASTNNNKKKMWNSSSDRGIAQHPRVIRQVLSKKFSWKNYPELENYLIAHRDEYLRQVNYSIEQKQYNNRLTNAILELATQHGYVFEGFSFVMLRDKIRCYYKSYLQTLRKRQQRKEEEQRQQE